MPQPKILIAGAGPTGLVLALWLTKAGVPLRIIDKLPAAGTTSRALVFHARNLEFYRQLGIDQFAVAQGIEASIGNLWLQGRAVGQIRFGDLGARLSRYSAPLIFPQDAHERMLIERLSAVGVQVERETELVGFTQSAAGVTAELRSVSIGSETVHVDYLAGCDGARSTVRETLQCDFPGGTYSDTYYVADIVAAGSVMNGQFNIALDAADFLAVFPMKGGDRARLVGAVRESLPKGRDLTWEDVRSRIIQDLNLQVKEVKWFSTYRVHHRVASSFQKGRVFLLGDAAHIHSPVGGQGMNTGIGDAVNLAWKLAAVLRGGSPPKLLDTYEPERIAFARRLVATTDRVFAFVSARGPLATWVRLHVVPTLVPFLFGFAAVRRKIFRIVSQLAIAYPQSALSQGSAGTIHGGGRLPWLEFRGTCAEDNFTPLSAMDWQVHCYGSPPSELTAFCGAQKIELHAFPWTPEARRAGVLKDAAYLLRPDGHVAIIDPRGGSARLSAYLVEWARRG